jgi:hypothetical protein
MPGRFRRVVDSGPVPTVDFWLDWRPRASVDQLRHVLPAIARGIGCQIVERELLTSGPGWAMFDLLDPELGPEPVGTMRAQEGEGGSQLFVAPGERRDEPALVALNRAALALYCGLLLRGLLAPPAPLEHPSPSLISTEA